MFHEINVNIEHVDVPRSSQKLQLRLEKSNKTRRRGRVKSKNRPRSTTKGK
jgi:hypothetical protein